MFSTSNIFCTIGKIIYESKSRKNIISISINVYLENWIYFILMLYGKKYASIFEPSSGGIGSKLNTASTTFKDIASEKNLKTFSPILDVKNALYPKDHNYYF